jgi:pimeloyl-ACP methyl ester carboxylesterase
MESEFLPFRSSQIHYSFWGKGPEIWFCIHGYGESSFTFQQLCEKISPEEFTVLAPDLPFHGRTEWKEGFLFTADDLVEILENILLKQGRAGAVYRLLGFSLGARIALCMAGRCPERVPKLMLVAPDGLSRNPWYSLATGSRMGNRLFRFSVRNPGWVFWFLKMGRFFRIIKPDYYRFTTHYFHDEGSREELYRRWTVLRNFRPNLASIKSRILANKIDVELVFAIHDHLIQIKKGRSFRKGIEKQCRLTLIPGGHQLFQEKHLPLIVSLLKD